MNDDKRRRTINDEIMTTMPINAYVIVLRADSICLGSPPLVRYLKAAMTNMTKNAIRPPPAANPTTRSKTGSRQLSCAILSPLGVVYWQLSQVTAGDTGEYVVINSVKEKKSMKNILLII